MDVLNGVKFPYKKSIELLGWKSQSRGKYG